MTNKKWLFTSFLLLALPTLAQVDLEQFENVTSEHYADSKSGFELAYPYRWQPRPPPAPSIDLLVSADSYNLPSFSVVVREVSTEEGEFPDQRQLAMELFSQSLGIGSQRLVEDLIEYDRATDFKGFSAFEVKFAFNSPIGEQIPLQMVILVFTDENKTYALAALDLYSPDSLSSDLLNIRDSFQILRGADE